MDASYAWHPGTDRVTSHWAVPVPLQPDELFSSWLVRAALTQGCDPLVLTGELWPKWRIWTTDPDRGLSEERLAVLTKASGIEASAFHASGLRLIASVVTTEPLDDLAIWPWMLALGSRNRKRHGGLQYCPACLKEDSKPYFRVQWRLAWHAACGKHGASLIDKCPHCNAVIEPHRLSAQEGDITQCASCKRDLREAVAVTADADALLFQQAADQVVKQGQGQYGINTLPAGEWFALSRYFVMLLRKAALGKSDWLSAFIKVLGVDMGAIAPPATGLVLELLPVQERAAQLAGARQMLNAGSERFLEAAKAACLAAPSLRERRQSVPLCIETMLQSLPDKNVFRERKQKDKIQKPRSRQAVMRMWARLQRKMQVAAR